jgi:hypothetical protein
LMVSDSSLIDGFWLIPIWYLLTFLNCLWYFLAVAVWWQNGGCSLL